LDDIRAALKKRERQAREQAFTRELREGASVKVALEPPRTAVPVPASAPSLGPEGAPVTIVQFVDYQCPYCHRAQSTIDEILSRYPGKVQLVHRDFPLEGHPAAMPAARASRCAGEQGKFWDYHRSLMKVKGPMDDADLKGRAASLKLDPGAFSSCLASERFDAAIRASFEEGTRAGVNSTPSYFVNGRLVAGAVPLEQFQEVVEAELERGQ
jgi:protein-disulfide isomerase